MKVFICEPVDTVRIHRKVACAGCDTSFDGVAEGEARRALVVQCLDDTCFALCFKCAPKRAALDPGKILQQLTTRIAWLDLPPGLYLEREPVHRTSHEPVGTYASAVCG